MTTPPKIPRPALAHLRRPVGLGFGLAVAVGGKGMLTSSGELARALGGPGRANWHRMAAARPWGWWRRCE